jgi:transposase
LLPSRRRGVPVGLDTPFQGDVPLEATGYRLLKISPYKHGSVNHGRKEYVRGEHHMNNVESFWHLFKVSIASTHAHNFEAAFRQISAGIYFPLEPPRTRERGNAMFLTAVSSSF